jgi:copper chaperone CopZ
MVGILMIAPSTQKEPSMITFRIPDMTCGRCAYKIGKAIAAADPGARVEFALEEQLVRIAPASGSGPELRSAIEAAGYSPAAHAAPPVRRPSSGCGCGCGTRGAVDVGQSSRAATGGCCG